MRRSARVGRPNPVRRQRPIGHVAPKLQFGSVVPLIRAAGVRRLNPGNDVARRLNGIPQLVGSYPRLQREAEHLRRSGWIIRQPAEQQITQLVAAESPLREAVGWRVEGIALWEVGMSRLEREARDPGRGEKIEGCPAGPFVRRISESSVSSAGSDLEDERVGGGRIKVVFVGVVFPGVGEFASGDGVGGGKMLAVIFGL